MSRVYVFNQLGGPEHEELVDRPVPTPGDGELLVAVRAAGVNPADAKIRAGGLGPDRDLPVAMGLEVAGVVAAVGDGVRDFAAGDEVLAPVRVGRGGFAEHTLVRAAHAVVKPAGISFVDAAVLPVAGTTAFDLTHQVEVDAGGTMLILGAGGGVGHLAAQVGRVRGLEVVGVASEAKRELVESTGATFVPSGAHFADAVRQLAPDGVDLVVDLVGGDALRQATVLATRPAGVVSAADGLVTRLGGSLRQRVPGALARITNLVADGRVDPHVTATFPLERAREALAVVESGHAAGKVVIEMVAP
ncbi:NADP-dependent oxidoreductase [Georgenia subflava]|uniref:Zinc-binding dehydrogenase n=1 Tax=Georgenia subflava TaxID=1622177 RepID=A0A6N7EGI9_9MICO|nr:NADP-dependent oxidoreductase [Georgenia subflava]MPV37150.1 zinc-binding dehydrogenase [Georgenia subflava]